MVCESVRAGISIAGSNGDQGFEIFYDARLNPSNSLWAG